MRESPGLLRGLGRFDATLLTINSIVGAGVLAMPAGLALDAGRLSLLLAIPPGYASAVWPAAGIALAAVLVLGNRVWPGIILGSFFVNIWTTFDAANIATASKSVAVACAIGVGAAFQALAGGYLVRRFVGFPTGLTEERTIGAFLALGGPASCVISPTIGTTSLLAAGAITPPQYLFSWWTWWVGDTIGVLLATPLVLIWTGLPRAAGDRIRCLPPRVRSTVRSRRNRPGERLRW